MEKSVSDLDVIVNNINKSLKIFPSEDIKLANDTVDLMLAQTIIELKNNQLGGRIVAVLIISKLTKALAIYGR